MSTWHQRKAGMPQLWHETLYTVVSDPPDEMLTVSRFADPVQAERLKENLRTAWVQERIAKFQQGHDLAVVSDAVKRDAAVMFYVLPPQR